MAVRVRHGLSPFCEEVYGAYPQDIGNLLERCRTAARAMLYLPHGPGCESGSCRKLSLGEPSVDAQLLKFAHVYLHSSVIYSNTLAHL